DFGPRSPLEETLSFPGIVFRLNTSPYLLSYLNFTSNLFNDVLEAALISEFPMISIVHLAPVFSAEAEKFRKLIV
ncbi:hypothetical protein, partial [Klebsiella variicola]|uniref:hypothetical protein n=1 Tax=Klebsiella variicola TaxID=244366 RepID=UPI001BAC68AF